MLASVVLTDDPVGVSGTAVPPDAKVFLRTRSAAVAAGVIASCAPLILLLANTDWFFTREGYLDPWSYIGLFNQYLDPDFLPEDYKLARLPWILSGFAASKLLPPVPAAFVLHGVFLCATSLALFAGIHALFRRPALAGVVTLSFGFFTLAHGSGSWDYHNTGAGAFYLATFALLALPATLNGSRPLLVASGVAAALAIHTNITLVNFLPALAFVHIRAVGVGAVEHPSSREIAARAAWIASGAVLITVLLGLINWSVGREFLFFQALIRLVVRFLDDPSLQRAFHKPWRWDWVLGAWHLSYLAAVFLAGIVWLAVDRMASKTSWHPVANALVVQFLAMSFVWIAWQSAGQTALDQFHFAYVLIPSCFVASSAILFVGWPDWCERHWLATLLLTTAALTFCLVVAQLRGISELAPLIWPVVFPVGTALFFSALAIHVWRPSLASVLLFVATFAYGNRLLSVPVDYQASDPCKVQAAVYGAIVDSATWLMKVDPLYTRVSTWFDDQESLSPKPGCPVRLGHMGNSITTMASVGYVSKAFPLPSAATMPDGVVREMAEGGRILAIISSQPAHAAEWQQRIEGMGLVREEIDRHVVRVLDSGFTIYAWSLERGSLRGPHPLNE